MGILMVQDAGMLAEVRWGLLVSCGMDTWGIVGIFEALENLA